MRRRHNVADLRTHWWISDGSLRPSALTKTLEGAVEASVEAVYQSLREMREEIVPESPQSEDLSAEPKLGPDDKSSASNSDIPLDPIHPEDNKPVEDYNTREEVGQNKCINEIINLISAQEDTTRPEDSCAGRFLRSLSAQRSPAPRGCRVPTLYTTRQNRAKIRHQSKKRNGQWHMSRSRKCSNLAKRAITRSGNAIYHAKAVKTVKFKVLLNSPEVKRRLGYLHARRTSFPDPSEKETRILVKEVEWPAGVEQIDTCKHNGVKFLDIGSFDPCQCVGDWFWDVCKNVASATFCTPKGCHLNARCSNAPRTLSTLKQFDAGRIGLGIYTTAALDIGDMVGEYCGELSEYPAIVQGQPSQARKQNSGYTLLYNAKSISKHYVYVDALKCGSITRFVSHACDPNAAFVEQQTRTRVKVLVKIIKDVKAGADITVHYGNEGWFQCACDDCWKARRERCAS